MVARCPVQRPAGLKIESVRVGIEPTYSTDFSMVRHQKASRTTAAVRAAHDDYCFTPSSLLTASPIGFGVVTRPNHATRAVTHTDATQSADLKVEGRPGSNRHRIVTDYLPMSLRWLYLFAYDPQVCRRALRAPAINGARTRPSQRQT